MNILWHSNSPLAHTGYGTQTATFVPRIKHAGHDIAVSAFWGLGGSAIEWEGITVYPGDEHWGNRTLTRLARHHGGDDCLIITLMDVWVLTAPSLSGARLASWVPVDHDPLPPKVLEFFQRTGARPIAMSRFGERKLAEHALDPLYVPHGIDTDVFRPRDEQRGEIRRMMGVPDDAFVVGMVAANKGIAPPRKAFPQVFQAFSRLRRDHPDAYLYLHTELAGDTQGINLGALAAACDIPSEAIKHTQPFAYELGATPTDMSLLMSALDVLANPSYGEGFGVPIMEAQACGTPVIITDFSAMSELCGAGWKVGGDPWYDATQGSFYRCPSVDGVEHAMREAYEARGDGGLRAKAREFALQYDADRVMDEFWTPVLTELDRTHRVVRLPAEPWLSRLIPASGRRAVDVGANTGDVACQLTDGFERVIAIEPHPQAATMLRERAPAVDVLQAAAGNTIGELSLSLFNESVHTSRFDDSMLDTLSRGEPTGQITVPVVTLDSLDLDGVDFLKIDVEGMEADVLDGAVELLAEQQPTVLVEIHAELNSGRCRRILENAGYEVERVPHPHPDVPAGHHWLFAPRPTTIATRDMVAVEAAA